MRKSTFYSFITILLAAAIVVACGIGSAVNGEWYKNPDFKTWFNSWGQGNVIVDDGGEEKPSTLIALTSDGKELHAGHTYAMPRALTVFSTQATASQYVPERELTIQANLNNPYIKGYYDWSVEFVNPEAAWATGKTVTDYVTVTPSEDGATAQLAFVEAFGEQIKVVAHLRDTLKSGECVIDYLADCIPSYKDSNAGYTDICDFNDGEALGGGFDFGVGTVYCEYKIAYAEICLSRQFVDTLQSYLTFDIDVDKLSDALPISVENEVYLEDSNIFAWATVKYSDIFEGFDNYPTAKKQAIYYAWYHAALDIDPSGNGNIGGHYQCGFTAYYNGQEIISRIVSDKNTSTIWLTGEAMGKNVQPDVEFNTNITFG